MDNTQAPDNRPKAEKISDRIVQIIVEKNLHAGDKLPNEYELALLLGVGRSTIREAIKALVSRNVLQVRRGAGTYISEKMGVADDPLGLTFYKNKQKLAMDLLEIRFMIEPNIASLAAANAKAEEIAQMQALCREVEQLIINGKNHMAKDVELHTCIAGSSKNRVMPNLIPIINRGIALSFDLTHSELLQETIETHREIVQAIAAHDCHGAYDAMLLHLAYNRRYISNEKYNSKHTSDVY